ncbi:MAG: ribosome maturation factor RimP [Alphaproteobacteria bacterium]
MTDSQEHHYIGTTTPLEDRLSALFAPALQGLGYQLVRVQLMGGQRAILQVMVDRADGKPVGVNDCTIVSRQLSPLLDVHDPVDGAYSLEVSSAGIDRPLTTIAAIVRYKGHMARVESRTAIEGRKRFVGTIIDVIDNNLQLELDGGEVAIPLVDIHRAKLVLTDLLLDQAQASGEAFPMNSVDEQQIEQLIEP